MDGGGDVRCGGDRTCARALWLRSSRERWAWVAGRTVVVMGMKLLRRGQQVERRVYKKTWRIVVARRSRSVMRKRRRWSSVVSGRDGCRCGAYALGPRKSGRRAPARARRSERPAPERRGVCLHAREGGARALLSHYRSAPRCIASPGRRIMGSSVSKMTGSAMTEGGGGVLPRGPAHDRLPGTPLCTSARYGRGWTQAANSSFRACKRTPRRPPLDARRARRAGARRGPTPWTQRIGTASATVTSGDDGAPTSSLAHCAIGAAA